MTNPTSNKTLSIGKLRPKAKTKDKSPYATGTMRIKRDLLLELYKQLSQSEDDEILANIAGWFNKDEIGKYMTIQLSAKYQRPEYRDDSRQWPCVAPPEYTSREHHRGRWRRVPIATGDAPITRELTCCAGLRGVAGWEVERRAAVCAGPRILRIFIWLTWCPRTPARWKRPAVL